MSGVKQIIIVEVKFKKYTFDFINRGFNTICMKESSLTEIMNG